MMKKILLAVVLCGGLGLTSVSAQQAEERLPGYLQAEKFTKSKLDKMLFSTTVDRIGFNRETISGLSIKPVKESSGMW
jgi:dipeptidyl-peptidase-4